jgi:hypothetical protein
MFRFTIRDLLWMTIVAAVCGGWFADHRAAAALFNSGVRTWHEAQVQLLAARMELEVERERRESAEAVLESVKHGDRDLHEQPGNAIEARSPQ